MSATPRLLTEKQVLDRLHIGRTKLRDLRLKGELLPVRIGTRNIRYRSWDVDRYMNRLRPAK